MIPERNNTLHENPILSTEKRIDSLAEKIAKDHTLKIELIKRFLKTESIKSLDDFKAEFEKTRDNENLDVSKTEIEIASLFSDIYAAKQKLKEKVSSSTKGSIEVLKSEIDSTQGGNNLLTKKYLLEELLLRIENPRNMGDQIAGLCVGLVNSGEITLKTLFHIGKGILNTPRDLTLLLSGKGKYDTWKRI